MKIDRQRAARGKQFLDAFGDAGAKYFALGLSFEQAQQRHQEAQRKRDEEAKRAELTRNLGDTGLARITSAIKLPAPKKGAKSAALKERLIRTIGDTPFARAAADISMPERN